MADQTLFRDTIFGLSSGALPAGVGVIRISGVEARNALFSLAGNIPPPRQAHLMELHLPGGEVLDRGLVLFFPGPRSFTGEDCAELHLHGGRAVIAAALKALSEMPGFRLAEAGEFTRRAFLNGKLDLIQAEGLADLIAADTEAERRFALENSNARHGKLYEGWRKRLIHAMAMIEAELDFADEGDVPGSVADSAWADIAALREEIESHVGDFRTAEILRKGFRVVILGAPNAGKSSLLNALARREIAIVTEEPGTTRDVLEVALDVAGQKIVLFDTAGIRDRPGRVEAIGIERAKASASQANLIIVLEDMSGSASPIDLPEGVKALRIGSKSDLAASRQPDGAYDHVVSARTGEGLDGLLNMLEAEAKASIAHRGEVMPFRLRHISLLREAGKHLEKAVQIENPLLELRAEELRLAATALGRISGKIDAEDLLDTIFSQFCIGK
ncbi:tRNA modification GTPase [Mesorhizobium sp. J18]|uniref:tRNA uridine-5-carboxymethylaminomethyl(34) synthesis GTPase MnmE n=1 Tax=Mesorhizobium sp. J18 TaxID=935263 RepID=UPI00119BDB60|nr:tRNA uridine-5-carboxymethylaminomethyl(34) synthesis GTPase MnmE [Mesorhizobium sp. J18]TWG88991.1 tRNA modification GTPase [Mesorhizobium sp. J18]